MNSQQKVKHIHTHNTACDRVAAQMGLDKFKVRQLVASFFGERGCKGLVKKGATLHIKGIGIFKPNRKRYNTDKKKTTAERIGRRIKKRLNTRRKREDNLTW